MDAEHIDDLTALDRLQCDLQLQCEELECRLRVAGDQARESAAHGFAQLHSLAASLQLLGRRIHSSSSHSKSDVVYQLSELASEAGRLGEVRAYVEAALNLERMIGDLEDDVFAAASTTVISSRKLKLQQLNPSTRLSKAAQILRKIETTIAELVSSRPQWERLTSAVDIRVDRAMAALRPIAVADYRGTLASIGWPPQLSPSKHVTSRNKLLHMSQNETKRVEQSFVSLTILQTVQSQRRKRGTTAVVPRELLWTIEEMVVPLSEKSEVHFKSWLDNPEFVFALAKRIAEEHIGAVDSVLQPMLDEAALPYSVREEWVSAVVNMVSEHLRKLVLPTLVKDLEDEDERVPTLWLHTVDETIGFDAKMEGLAGIAKGASLNDGFGAQVLGLHRPCISVFADRHEWLALWVKFEKDVALRKLRLEFNSDAVWKVGSDSKAPVGVKLAVSLLESAVERCRTLPEAAQRLEFVKGAAFPILDEFLSELWQRCHEAEALKSMADDGSLRQVAVCVNAACYCEQTLAEWSEDMFFLEMKFADRRRSVISDSELEGSILDDELTNVRDFKNTWLGKMSSVISRGFEAGASDYFRNKKRWSDETLSEAVHLSGSLVVPFAVMQNQLQTLKDALDHANFVELWQKLIPSLDQMIFQGVVTSGARFSHHGARQFGVDVKALFVVFRAYCPRPASFFIALSDAVKLLSLSEGEALDLMDKLSVLQDDDEERDEDLDEVLSKVLRQTGVRKMTPEIAARILGFRNLRAYMKI